MPHYKLPANNQEWSTMNRLNQDSTPDEAIEKNPIVERREHMAPRTPVEELIAGIYASSLNVSPLGVYDNLHTLSITPQAAAQLNLRLRQIFDVNVPVDQLLMYDTIDALVNFLSGLWGGREIVEEIAWTFLQIEQLSDNEVRSQLANELSTGETDVTRK
jgi:phosphopantetheine binding protein